MRNMVGRINIYKKLSGIFVPILAADNSEFVIHRSNLNLLSLPMLLLFYTPACHKVQTKADNEQYRQNIFKVKHFYASPHPEFSLFNHCPISSFLPKQQIARPHPMP